MCVIILLSIIIWDPEYRVRPANRRRDVSNTRKVSTGSPGSIANWQEDPPNKIIINQFLVV
jgi:hypothetical protein